MCLQSVSLLQELTMNWRHTEILSTENSHSIENHSEQREILSNENSDNIENHTEHREVLKIEKSHSIENHT